MKRILLYVLISCDLLLLLTLSFISPIAALGFAIFTAMIVAFFMSHLGYIYFLIIWIPLEVLILPEDGNFRILRLIIINSILLLAWFKFWLSKKKIQLPAKIYFTPLIVLFIWMGISLLFSPNPTVSLIGYLKLITYLFIFLLVYNLVEDTKDVKKILYFSLFISVFIFLATFYQFFILNIGRVKGLFGSSNTLGIYCFLTTAIVLLLIKMESKNKVRKFLLWIWLGASILALVCSGSRASLFGFVVLIFVYLLLNRRFKTLVFSFLISLSLMLYIVSTEKIFQDFAKMTRLVSGTTGRTIIWENTFPLIKDNLITGVGPGGVPGVLFKYVKETNPIINIQLRHAIELGLIHNGYLQKAAELGIIGLFLVLWVNINFIRYFRNYLLSYKNTLISSFTKIAIALLFCKFAHSFFESSMQIGPFVDDMWSMIIFIAVIKMIELDKMKNKKPELDTPA